MKRKELWKGGSASLLVRVVMGVVLLTVASIPYAAAKPFPSPSQNRTLDSVKYLLQKSTSLLSSSSSTSSSLTSTLSCVSCEAVVTFLHYAVEFKWTEEEVVKGAVELCVHLDSQVDLRVCQGLAHMFKAEAITVFADLALEPRQVCGVVLGPVCASPHWPLPSWNVSLPANKPPVNPHVLPKAGSPTLRVLHLTDIHWDKDYAPGSNPTCQEPLCCRADDGPPEPGVMGAGYYGDYRNCDTPTWTLEGLLAHLSTQKYDYIMWTGDLPAHNIWNQTRADQTSVLHRLSALLTKFFPSTPILPALGNHESSPVNSFPPRDITGKQSIGWLYDALADSWKQWLPTDALHTVRQGGFYTVSPYPGFRVVAINTNACNNMNWWLYLNTTDPDGQLAWLVNVLQTAENSKEKVHIMGHIPPGISDCLEEWSRNYYNIVDRYESTIAGQFFGHTHFDHFEVFYDVQTHTRPTSVAYISPSVTPYSNLNMGYRVFTVDGNYTHSSWEVLNHETYILNLTAANTRRSPPTWQLEYTAKDTYGMKSLFPEDWDRVITKMQKNNTLLQTFYRYYLKSNTPGGCDEKCSSQLLCDMRSARSHSKQLLCPDLHKTSPSHRHPYLPKLC